VDGVLDLMVQTFPTEPVTTVASSIENLGGQIQDISANDLGGIMRVSLDANNLVALARIPAIRWIEPFPEYVLHNDVARGDSIMAAESIWANLGLYGEGQVVAISDTGLDTGNLSTLHQDFLGSPTGCSGTNRIVAVFARGRTGDWSDSCRCLYNSVWYYEGGHGTHVAGSVLGNGCRSGSNGVPDYSGSHAGLAPQAGLVMQSVMGSGGGTCGDYIGGCALTGIPTDLNGLFSQAQGAGASIHTNSWGSDANGEYTTDSQNTDLYMWNHKDYTILFSAGNAGTDANSDGVIDLDSTGAPATAKNCITVGGSENYRLYGGVNPEHSGDPWDELQCGGNPGSCSTPPAAHWGNCWPLDFGASPVCPDRLSDNAEGVVAFSSRGPTDDGRIKPDVIAPGSNVLSTKSQGTYVGGGWGDGENGYYQFMGGTSMATPLTAGGVALIREFFTNQAMTPSSALIKATLIHGATDLYPGQYGSGAGQEISTRRPNNVEGWGRVNLERSLIGTGGRRIEYFDYYNDSQGRPGLRTNEYDTWTYNVGDGSVPFMSTLVWTDYPGSALVNDLDLSVVDPNSAIHYPNRLGSYDRTNNVEHVDISGAIPTGSYTVRVGGYNVAQAGSLPRQTYAVVDSGAMTDVIAAESLRNIPSGDQPKMMFGKTGIDLDFAVSAGGYVTISMTKVSPSHSSPSGKTFLQVGWHISSTMTGFSAQLVFHYGDSDLPTGMDETTIAAYRWNGLAWEDMGGTVDTDANTITVNDVTAFSEWALGGNSPTAVTLSSFTATWDVDGVRVEWETAAEIDTVGFNVWRSESPDGGYVQVNDTLIPAESLGGVWGGAYSYIDSGVTPGAVYHYRLEELEVSGARNWYGPASTDGGHQSTAVTLRRLTARAALRAYAGMAVVGLLVLGIAGLALLWRKRRAS
jgi:subtilisin family serine protease